MLELLHIENIAIIERADISFRTGFNVLTGENCVEALSVFKTISHSHSLFISML